jgi:integrase
MRLTQTTIAALSVPPGKAEAFFWDDKLKGFGLRLRAGGKRTWLIQYRAGSQQRRVSLGSADTVDAVDARADAKKRLAEVAQGGDPQARKLEERERSAVTFEANVPRYLDWWKRDKGHKIKPGTLANIELHLSDHWRPLAKMPVHAIDKKKIASVLTEIAAERGPIAANRARASLSGFFSWALRQGLIEANPVIGTLKQGAETERERVLDDAELVAICRACADDDFGRIIMLLLLTAQRRDEVGGMAKSEITLGSRKWTIPGERTKNHRPNEVPLSEFALAIVEDAAKREDRIGRDRLFGYGRFINWVAPKMALDKRIEETTGAPLPHWTLHDLRRTATTRMAELGVQPHVLEAILNHKTGTIKGVAAIYNRASYWQEKKQALDLWAAHVDALLAGKDASNIVPLKA